MSNNIVRGKSCQEFHDAATGLPIAHRCAERPTRTPRVPNPVSPRKANTVIQSRDDAEIDQEPLYRRPLGRVPNPTHDPHATAVVERAVQRGDDAELRRLIRDDIPENRPYRLAALQSPVVRQYMREGIKKRYPLPTPERSMARHQNPVENPVEDPAVHAAIARLEADVGRMSHEALQEKARAEYDAMKGLRQTSDFLRAVVASPSLRQHLQHMSWKAVKHHAGQAYDYSAEKARQAYDYSKVKAGEAYDYSKVKADESANAYCKPRCEAMMAKGQLRAANPTDMVLVEEDDDDTVYYSDVPDHGMACNCYVCMHIKKRGGDPSQSTRLSNPTSCGCSGGHDKDCDCAKCTGRYEENPWRRNPTKIQGVEDPIEMLHNAAKRYDDNTLKHMVREVVLEDPENKIEAKLKRIPKAKRSRETVRILDAIAEMKLSSRRHNPALPEARVDNPLPESDSRNAMWRTLQIDIPDVRNVTAAVKMLAPSKGTFLAAFLVSAQKGPVSLSQIDGALGELSQGLREKGITGEKAKYAQAVKTDLERTRSSWKRYLTSPAGQDMADYGMADESRIGLGSA
jgi:hypothetical protein